MHCFLQGSDIETLGPEAVVEDGAEMFEHSTVEEPNLQELQTSTSAGKTKQNLSYFLCSSLRLSADYRKL